MFTTVRRIKEKKNQIKLDETRIMIVCDGAGLEEKGESTRSLSEVHEANPVWAKML